MKKVAAIFLLGIFSFNIFGYRILYNYLSQHADYSLATAIDNDEYQDAELISIKKPVTLPYYTNSKTYQRTDGEVIMNGSIYRYVKSRIYNDSLEMLCIPHTSKMELQNARNEFFKLVNDFNQSGNDHKKVPGHTQLKSMVSEFEEIQKHTIANTSMRHISSFFYNYVPGITWISLDSAERPPNVS